MSDSTEQARKSTQLWSRVFLHLMQIAPHRRGPAGIVGSPTDDVQVELGHHIADTGKVYLRIPERSFDEVGHKCRLVHGAITQVLR